jgi:hypothetical protein
MRRLALVTCAFLTLALAHGDAPVQPPTARDYGSPGGVGPSRGWYVWQKFNPDTWEVIVTRDPPGDSWQARVLPYCTTYRYQVYGARPDALVPGERVNLFFAPDEKSRWGYVCHFQDELSQMKGHNHAWHIRSATADGFKASLWMGNEKKLDDKELEFTIDPKCRKYQGGKRVNDIAPKPGDHVFLTWVWRDRIRVALLYADDASLDVIKKEEQERVAREVANDGVAGHVEGVEEGKVKLLVFSTFWSQMRDFKPGQTMHLRATGKGFRPAGDAIAAKLISYKVGGKYGSGPTDAVLELPGGVGAKTLQAWADGRVVRLIAAPQKRIAVNASVLDADSGKVVAARVYVRDAAGAYLEGRIKSLDAAGSAIGHVRRRPPALEVHTTVSAHPFAVDLAPGKYTFIVERGKEYHPLTQEVTVGDEPASVELKLHRWIDMPKLGWYSGDTHIHRPLEEIPNAIVAEDLNVAFPMSYWVTEAYAGPGKAPKSAREPGRLIEVDKTHVIYPRNTEYEIFTVKKANHMLGAFFVLNHKTVLDAGVPPVTPIAELAHKEGALIELDKHNWPWTMIIVPVMKADLYELSNNHVWRTEFLFGNWAEREGEYMKVERNEKGWTEWGWIDYGMQNYYALLNCGFRLKATGGTAAGVHPVPVGFGRVYVHQPDGFSYDGWVKGLSEGRSFVTTGPMLFATVNDKDPGHIFRGPGEYRVKGVAASALPLGRIELIVNGAIAKTLKPENKKTATGGFESAFEEVVKVESGSWICVRCFEDRPDKRIRFAHTSPVWIDVEGKPVRPRKPEIEYLLKRVEDQIKRSSGVLPKEALEEYETARKVYRGLVE